MIQCSHVCSVLRGCILAHLCELDSGHDGEHSHQCEHLANLERAVIDTVTKWRTKMTVYDEERHRVELGALMDAVDALLREREGGQ